MATLKERISDAGSYLVGLATNAYFWGGLALLVVLLVGFYLLVDKVVFPSYTRQDTAVSLPNVVNQPFEQARMELEERDLSVERIVQRYNANFPRDVVVDQNPPPNSRVKPGRHVYLTVNSGELNRV